MSFLIALFLLSIFALTAFSKTSDDTQGLFRQLEQARPPQTANLLCRIAERVYSESSPTDLRGYEKTILQIPESVFELTQLRLDLLVDMDVDTKAVFSDIQGRMNHASPEGQCQRADDDLTQLTPRLASAEPNLYLEYLNFESPNEEAKAPKACKSDKARWGFFFVFAAPFIDSTSEAYSKIVSHILNGYEKKTLAEKQDTLQKLAIFQSGSVFAPELGPLLPELEKMAKNEEAAPVKKELDKTIAMIKGGIQGPLSFLNENPKPERDLFSLSHGAAMGILMSHASQYVGSKSAARAAHWYVVGLAESVRDLDNRYHNGRARKMIDALWKLGKDAAGELPNLQKVKQTLESQRKEVIKDTKSPGARDICFRAKTLRRIWLLDQHIGLLNVVIGSLATSK